MFSLCRLCAKYTKPDELVTDITELESKLIRCYQWKPSENEVQMPKKACTLCVNELQRSWDFFERIDAAEKKLNKLISEQTRSTTDTTENHSNSIGIKAEPDIQQQLSLIELEESKHDSNLDADNGDNCDIDDDVFGESIGYFNDESSHSNENQLTEPPKPKVEKKHDPFLAPLGAEDCFDNGSISAEGVAKLESLFSDMKTMSWNDCQYKCTNCNRIIKGSHNLYSHIRSIHLNELMSIKISCFYCNFNHRREYTLNQHIATEHFIHLKFR